MIAKNGVSLAEIKPAREAPHVRQRIAFPINSRKKSEDITRAANSTQEPSMNTQLDQNPFPKKSGFFQKL